MCRGVCAAQQHKPVVNVLGMPTPQSAVVAPFAPKFLDEQVVVVPHEEMTKSAAALANPERRMRPRSGDER